jgi:hypothetical protein
MREVELWENERWGTHSGGEKGSVGWGKGSLRAGERSAWTRGRDGWSGVLKDGSDAVRSCFFFLVWTSSISEMIIAATSRSRLRRIGSLWRRRTGERISRQCGSVLLALMQVRV